jgi:ABC-type nitrate/sulfonate/bicarbonate transport system substrate-binding protein
MTAARPALLKALLSIGAIMAALVLPATGASAADKITVLTGPTVLYDALWMADAQGFYKAENLDVQYRLFPTGVTALQTFKTGQGDVVLTGDLPALLYWENNNHDYRMINVLERDSKGYTITAKTSLTKPADLAGKTIATRVGSNGSFFISEYLRLNNLKPGDVTIKNLDAQVLPTALCQGDIDAYFIWQPFGQRAMEICPDKAHQLTTAEGYVRGYAIAGARPEWLNSKEGKDIAIRFLRATYKGKEVADKDPAAVAKYAQEKYQIEEKAARSQWEINERVETLDAAFNTDFCKLTKWMLGEKMLKSQVDLNDFVWMDGVKALGSDKLVPALKPCAGE